MNTTNPKLNAAGYPDPTAYEALAAVHREERRKVRPYRPLVYVCSPLAEDIARNMERARQYCKFAVGRGVTSRKNREKNSTKNEGRETGKAKAKRKDKREVEMASLLRGK